MRTPVTTTPPWWTLSTETGDSFHQCSRINHLTENLTISTIAGFSWLKLKHCFLSIHQADPYASCYYGNAFILQLAINVTDGTTVRPVVENK